MRKRTSLTCAFGADPALRAYRGPVNKSPRIVVLVGSAETGVAEKAGWGLNGGDDGGVRWSTVVGLVVIVGHG